ncbi:hypothetical protein KI688_006789 [Linnemannia hyalina]|uniref:Uncharacterized protein n=1 Tax=Linnemannia hyalina TaxID=64524 RepID=A0A9P8BQM0_9FUNG|nr:hypothetical protein KI688_006789 [Linnemannia hyalina]
MDLADLKGIRVSGGIVVTSQDLVEDAGRPILQDRTFTAIWRFYKYTTGKRVKDSFWHISNWIPTRPIEQVPVLTRGWRTEEFAPETSTKSPPKPKTNVEKAPASAKKPLAEMKKECFRLAAGKKREAQRLIGIFVETLRIRTDSAEEALRIKLPPGKLTVSEEQRTKARRGAASGTEREIFDHLCERIKPKDYVEDDDEDATDKKRENNSDLRDLKGFGARELLPKDKDDDRDKDKGKKEKTSLGIVVNYLIDWLVTGHFYKPSRRRGEIEVKMPYTPTYVVRSVAGQLAVELKKLYGNGSHELRKKVLTVHKKGVLDASIDIVIQEQVSAFENFLFLNKLTSSSRRIVPLTTSHQPFVSFSERIDQQTEEEGWTSTSCLDALDDIRSHLQQFLQEDEKVKKNIKDDDEGVFHWAMYKEKGYVLRGSILTDGFRVKLQSFKLRELQDVRYRRWKEDRLPSRLTSTVGGIDFFLQEIRNVLTCKEDIERLWPGVDVKDIRTLTLDAGQACIIGAFAHLPEEIAKRARSLGYLVVGLNEYYTSKKCPRCGQFVGQVDMRRFYCSQFQVFHHRDVMAAENMANIVQGYLLDLQRLDCLHPIAPDGNMPWKEASSGLGTPSTTGPTATKIAATSGPTRVALRSKGQRKRSSTASSLKQATSNQSLWCIVDGDPMLRAFELVIPSSVTTLGQLRSYIHLRKPIWFKYLEAEDLTLWSVSIPITKDNEDTPILLEDVPSSDKNKLGPTDDVSELFQQVPLKKTIHVIVQRPPPAVTMKRLLEQDPQYLPQKKRIRIEEGWKPFTASDGILVDLPPYWIDILASTEFVPKPRAAFDHLKGNLQAGDAIIVPSMGQNPKDFGLYGQDHNLFVTEQMLELWDEMRGDQEFTYRRILSGPMGVGKSYLSYFLAARAYAEGWLVLYISDAGVLDKNKQDESALQAVKRFLALNKDILTGAEMEMLVNDYNGTDDISGNAMSVIFGTLLKSRDRKTLLLVDEHGKLFEKEPYVPDKFRSLVPLLLYNWWGEDAKGSRVVFTGTAHAKYEMGILEESYRFTSLVLVGPLSMHVFSKLLDMYPRLAAPAIRKEVTAITNCVPRELVHLSVYLELFPDPIAIDNLQVWTSKRTKVFLSTAKTYYESRTPFRKNDFYEALVHTFLGSTSIVDFEWDFLDLGLIYRCKDVGRIGTHHHILCRPAQRALLELFKNISLPDAIKKRICDGSLDENEFEGVLYHQLICATKPIVLGTTDLNGKNPDTISLDFSLCETLRAGMTCLESDHEMALTRGYDSHPRFDFMLGPMFMQVSVSDFGKHNTASAELGKAFNDRDNNGTNQIERYLNDLYGPGHSAKIDNSKFIVTKNGVDVLGFRIVYICGSPGQPSHSKWVKKFPDVRHVSFEEVKENLFKNIVTSTVAIAPMTT